MEQSGHNYYQHLDTCVQMTEISSYDYIIIILYLPFYGCSDQSPHLFSMFNLENTFMGHPDHEQQAPVLFRL